MPKTISKTTKHRIYIAALSVGLGLFLSAVTVSSLFAQKTASKTAGTAHLGEFNLRSFESIESEFNKNGANSYLLTKPDLTSPRYDFAAVALRLTIQKGLAQSVSASGDVRVTVRDKALDGTSKQTINAACNQARYKAGLKPGEGHIDLTGNLVFKVYTPGLAEPLILTGETGTIDLLGPNQSRYRINKGSATVTPIEPIPAPTKKP